jgi:hypothetical protein
MWTCQPEYGAWIYELMELAVIAKPRGLQIYETILQPLRKFKFQFKLFYEGEHVVDAQTVTLK